MESFARIIKLKSGSEGKVVEWTKTMNARKSEALETIREEGVEIESWFSVSLEGEEYLICYMRSQSQRGAEKVASESTHPIDEIHQQFKVDTWVRGAGGVGKLLLDLSTRE